MTSSPANRLILRQLVLSHKLWCPLLPSYVIQIHNAYPHVQADKQTQLNPMPGTNSAGDDYLNSIIPDRIAAHGEYNGAQDPALTTSNILHGLGLYTDSAPIVRMRAQHRGLYFPGCTRASCLSAAY